MTEEKRKERLIKEINKKRRQLDDFAKKKGFKPRCHYKMQSRIGPIDSGMAQSQSFLGSCMIF